MGGFFRGSLASCFVLLLLGSGSASAKGPLPSGPDLQVGSLTAKSKLPMAGDSLVVKDTVRNTGKRKAAASVLEYVLSANPKRDKVDRRIGRHQVREIAPGASRLGSGPVSIPSDLPAGQIFLIACADATGKVEEVDEHDNCSPALALMVRRRTALPTPSSPLTDTSKPVVLEVNSPLANGAYPRDALIPISVRFSEPVLVTGTPQLLLETGATDRLAIYSGGSGTNTLTFTYTVLSGDASPELDYHDTGALMLNGGAIKDLAGNDAVLTLAALGSPGFLKANKQIAIDGLFPTVSEVTSASPNGAYAVGELVFVSVKFSESVAVAGEPLLLLETGATDRLAIYSGGSGTNTLTFTYTVLSGDTSPDLDYHDSGALMLNSGAVQDLAGNKAVLTLAAPGGPGSLASKRALVIDGIAPIVTGVTAATGVANGTYGTGRIIPIEVTFDKPVAVTGAPQLLLETGATDYSATYLSGSGTSTLTFRYQQTLGNTSPDLDYHDSAALTLNGGTIERTNGNPAQLTLPAPGASGSLGANRAIVLTGLPLQVTNVSSFLENRNYTLRPTLPFQITFSEPVAVTGVPQLLFETGATDYQATYESGSGTNELTFRYLQTPGNVSADLDYHDSGALTLNGGTIKDLGDNPVALTLPAPSSSGSLGANKAIVLTGLPPRVENVTVAASTPNGTYGTGSSFLIEVRIEEGAQVTGTPQLLLETGATDRSAAYESRSGNTLRFRYTVVAGDTSADLDYHDSGALTLNGGTIKDLDSSYDVILTLPPPGSPGSLGANRAIAINGS